MSPGFSRCGGAFPRRRIGCHGACGPQSPKKGAVPCSTLQPSPTRCRHWRMPGRFPAGASRTGSCPVPARWRPAAARRCVFRRGCRFRPCGRFLPFLRFTASRAAATARLAEKAGHGVHHGGVRRALGQNKKDRSLFRVRSVLLLRGRSEPVSRVLSGTTIYLGLLLPTGSSHSFGDRDGPPPCDPAWCCSG